MSLLRTIAVISGGIATLLGSDAVAVPAAPYAPAMTGHTTFVYPVMGPEKSSDFGPRKHPVRKVMRHHNGVDLAAPAGAPIRSIAPGHVIYADPWGGYGKVVVIKHANGMTSHYGHMESITVNPGQAIKAGDVIGTVGSSGLSTGPHLHFEIRINGTVQHPEKFLPGLAMDGQG